MEKVELRTAFSWRCPKCRKRNFVATVPVELTDDERASLTQEYGQLEGEGSELVRAPKVVSCSGCKEKFEAYVRDLC